MPQTATATPLDAQQGFSRDAIEEYRQTFGQQGYLVFKSVVPRERLEALRRSILAEHESARQSGKLFDGGGGLTGHLNCFPGEGSRFAYEALRDRGITDLIRALAPEAVRDPHVQCNVNLPGSVVQHYHVDSDYTQGFLIANVATVDTDVANGAIELAPGTHRKFYKFWRFAIERPHRNGIRVPMSQGDVLVRTSNLWHRGMPNLTNTARPMLAFTWQDGGSQQADAFQRDGGSGIRFYPNWYRPNFLGRLRERTFLAAPITYSAYRFARSLIGNKGY
jgi:hypothetical protein